MCRLGKLVPSGSAEIVAKLEFFEPGGSIKDRAAVSMLDAAQRDGRLAPGMTVVEASGGNTGVGLAMACAVRGHPCVIVLPSDTSKEKIAVLRTFGAEVIRARTDVPGSHPEGYVGRAKAYARDHGAFLPDQFTNPANPAAHETSTALEILEQCGGKLDAFVACVGSGGTIAGIGRVLRARLPSVSIVGAATQPHSVVEGVTDEIDADATHGTPPDRVIGRQRRGCDPGDAAARERRRHPGGGFVGRRARGRASGRRGARAAKSASSRWLPTRAATTCRRISTRSGAASTASRSDAVHRLLGNAACRCTVREHAARAFGAISLSPAQIR